MNYNPNKQRTKDKNKEQKTRI